MDMSRVSVLTCPLCGAPDRRQLPLDDCQYLDRCTVCGAPSRQKGMIAAPMVLMAACPAPRSSVMGDMMHSPNTRNQNDG